MTARSTNKQRNGNRKLEVWFRVKMMQIAPGKFIEKGGNKIYRKGGESNPTSMLF